MENVDLNSLSDINPFKLIGSDWMLITSGGKERFNTMTASWGGLGVLWNKKVAFCFVRPQRFTFEFMEKNDSFSLSFFKPSYREALRICGSKSGRDCNKVKESQLTPCFDEEAPYFKESSMVLICRKIYSQFIDPACMNDATLESNYKLRDYHKVFIGEINKCMVEL